MAEPSRPSLFVTGAAGFIGRHVVTQALNVGHEVATLSRRDWLDGPPVPLDKRFLGAFPFDLPDAAFQGIDTIIHLAWLTTSEGGRVAQAVNVEGSRHLLQKAERHGVRKIVFISSQSARKDGASAYARTKAAVEELFLDAPLPVTILRPGLVYGPGGTGLFARMRATVRRLPVLPVLGSGRTPVQPIHVSDLAAAILRCLESGRFDGRVLCLGDPRPTTLAEFLRSLCHAECGRVKPVLRVPIRPLIPLVEALESASFPLPVTSDNLRGAETADRMETRADLEELALPLRELGEGLRQLADEEAAGRAMAASAPRALSLAVVGAGKMGLVHAVTADRQPGMRLAALIDPNRKSRGMLAGMGLKAPGFASLAEACRTAVPDAAVIATPPSTHAELARECVRGGIRVLVEKPISPSAEGLEAFRRELAGMPVQVGYLAPGYPQFRAALRRLREGSFGTARSFEAFCLLGPSPKSTGWEVRPEISGGGVLMNVGGHAVSMIRAAFGDPDRVSGELLRLHGSAVEDSFVARFEYPAASGSLYASWAMPAYPNPENRLVIRTDEGSLYCTNNLAFFRRTGGEVTWTDHQLAYREGFNLAPDFSGGGVTAELHELGRLACHESAPQMSLEEGAAVERLLHELYARSAEARRFSGSYGEPADEPESVPATSPGAASVPLVHDLRRLEPTELPSPAAGTPPDVAGYLTFASQSRRWTELGVPGAMQTLVVPDFLRYARLLGQGQAVELLKTLGWRGASALSWQAPKSVLSQRGPTFWAAAESLVAADLAYVPRKFAGTLVLHHFLTDLAVALDQTKRLERLLRQIAARHRQAAVGVQTSILPDTLSALTYVRRPLAVVHFLSSPDNEHLRRALALHRTLDGFAACRFVAEVGAVPGVLAAAAESRPHDWLNGAEALAVEPQSSPWAEARERRMAELWRHAFPGVPLRPQAL